MRILASNTLDIKRCTIYPTETQTTIGTNISLNLQRKYALHKIDPSDYFGTTKLRNQKLGLELDFLFQLSSMLLGITDPFVPFENLLCAIFMGGLVDVFQVITNKTFL